MRQTIYLFFFVLISFLSTAQEPDCHRTHHRHRKEMDREYRREVRAEWRDSMRTRIRERFDNIGPDYNADSVRRELERGSYFTLFKDNYFIGGIPLGDKIKAENSNVKFQVSISQRLTKSILPFDTYLFLQFSQKTIWNVLEESLPMYDLNFNPGVGIGHLIIRQNRYIGKTFLMLEHESNGKDSLASRSWNKISLGTYLMINKNFDIQTKFWIPIIDGENNKDILKYNGIGHFGINYKTRNERLHAGLLTTWRTKSFSFNTQWEFSYKLNRKVNQFLFIQYYNGYGEYLFDYNKYKSVVRLGFVIKPRDFSIF